jgi:uncharacterized SAM-binding protein YcdF (DUF218 family)
MFFFLSKTLNYLTMPLTIIFLMMVASALLRNAKWKKRLFWTALISLFIFSNDFLANEIMNIWEVKTRPYASMRPHEMGIVLTGATLPNTEPNDRVYFTRGADRVTHTVQLYKLGLVKKILISGGSGRLSGESEPEADKFKAAMVLMGVPDSAITLENETRNTAESAIQVKKMLDSLHIKAEDCLLITSAFHMRRSLACYQHQGIKLETFSTDFYTHPRSFHLDVLIVPRIEAMNVWNKLIKEWVGFVAYKLAGYV